MPECRHTAAERRLGPQSAGRAVSATALRALMIATCNAFNRTAAMSEASSDVDTMAPEAFDIDAHRAVRALLPARDKDLDPLRSLDDTRS